MPHPNHVNPRTGLRYGFEEEQRRKKAEGPEALEQEIALLERLKTAADAREDLLTFARFTMPNPAAPDDPLQSTYEAELFHEQIAAVLTQFVKGELMHDDGSICKQLIFEMPPRHGKTELATKRNAAWISGRHPEWSVAVASYSDAMAQDFGADTRAILTSPQFKQVFPKHKLRRGGTAKDNIQTEEGGRLVFVGRGGALTGRGANCLAGNSVVETTKGSKLIKDVCVGEKVLSCDLASGELVYRRVQAVAERPRSRLHRITDSVGRMVEATSDHRFYTRDGWREAAQLAPGDRLLCAVRLDRDKSRSGGSEALSQGADRVLLQQRLLGPGSEPYPARSENVSSVRGTGPEDRVLRIDQAGADFLFDRVYGCGAAGRVGPSGSGPASPVRSLQCDVLTVGRDAAVLLDGVQEQVALIGHDWREQPALEGRRVQGAHQTACGATLSRDAPLRDEAGRRAMRDLPVEGQTRSPSHRREPGEQSRDQFGDRMPPLSRTDALFFGEGSTVVAVEDTCCDAAVYDIQVEETENFFANGVLVHNCLLIDDLYKDHEEARSPNIREQAWNWFTKVAMTRRMGKKLVMITMTRWHTDDIVGRITDPDNPCYNAIEAAKWKIIRLPAIAEHDDPLGRAEGQPLWPARFDLDFLQSQQRLDPLGFAALYQQRPTVADGVLFRRENIRRYNPADLPDDLRYYCTSDHAVGTKQRNDPSCFGKAGVDKQDNLWLTDLFWQRVPTDQAVEAMLAMGSGANAPIIWWAERGHISQSIGPFLYKRMAETGIYINVREVTPVGDKEQRAQSIAARAAMGKVYIPNGPTWDKMVEEMLAFPNGIHDDTVDMLALFGLGLQSQFGKRAPPPKKEEPKFGSLNWVKMHDTWAAERKAALSTGGF